MNEENKKEEEYTVQELINELMADESWEQNPALRGAAIGMLMMKLPSA